MGAKSEDKAKDCVVFATILFVPIKACEVFFAPSWRTGDNIIPSLVCFKLINGFQFFACTLLFYASGRAARHTDFAAYTERKLRRSQLCVH